ncbi:hypothetical protein EG68_08590 [Paragonimus skrjabini miyazakii]|uniref:ADP-ribosyl cyclase/cyclic ADP-ribose hydrolase n=1 Tax=Paragonimus skrjabini miyazakii TaxID=59628 RepID=A0A8S9YFG5_9TREM|nr:hypothetical protein EG68_08590 [Paragonimus skrjabini miyazakii]
MYTTEFKVVLVLLLGSATVLGQKTSDLERLVTGRCIQWAQRNGALDLDCVQVWTSFEAILTDQHLTFLCVMDPKMFDPLVQTLFEHMPSMSKAFLWSKTAALSTGLCANTGACYIFDGLNWCDKNITGGKDYATACGCTGKAEMVYAFWKSASNAYSKRVHDDVGIILNGSIGIPFNKNSTLATVELPNLKQPQVKQVTAYLVHDLDEGEYRQKCDSETMLELEREVTKRNISYNCEEDPVFIKHYQCIWAPTNKRCLLSGSSRVPHILNNIWTPAFLILLIGNSV